MKLPKTNAMRMLDQTKINYQVMTYDFDEEDLTGLKAAQALNLPPAGIYKTLVLHGDKTGYLVCCLPVDQEADLKALAAISGNKRVDMIPLKDLLPLTGYIRGGCSPIGMKKKWPTYIDEQVNALLQVAVSGGQRGVQILLSPDDLIKMTAAQTGDFARAASI